MHNGPVAVFAVGGKRGNGPGLTSPALSQGSIPQHRNIRAEVALAGALGLGFEVRVVWYWNQRG